MDLFYDICNKNTDIMRRGLPLLTLTWRSVDVAESVSGSDVAGVGLVSSDGSSFRLRGTSGGSTGSGGGSLGMTGSLQPGSMGSVKDTCDFLGMGMGSLGFSGGLLPGSGGLGDSGFVLGTGASGSHLGGVN